MIETLQDNIKQTIQSKVCRVLILSSNDMIFSSGHDLKEFDVEPTKIFSSLVELQNLMQNAPLPIIAQIKGHAIAAGCQLICSCDLITASQSAKFSTPGIKNGIFCSTPGAALIHSVNMPLKICAKMLFTGEPISANEAYQYGMVSQLFDDNELEKGTLALAQKISSYSKEVISLGKQCLYKQINLNRNDAFEYAKNIMVENTKLTDAKEGINAFLQKRPPKWT